MRQKLRSAGPPWLRAALAAACVAIVPATIPAQSADTTITSRFTKQATAVRPGGAVPAFGQVAVGQRIDYVLTAIARGTSSVPASGIVDVLSPNQSYVPGSLHLPPGWTAAPFPPYSPNPPNRTVYSAPAGASMLSFQLPVGGSATSVGASGKGDGMYPIPAANGRIYAVYHHQDSGGHIDCWIATTLDRCPDTNPLPFPRPISAGDSVGTLYNFNGALVQQRYIYYAAFHRYTRYAGLACWDTAIEAECPFQPVGTSPVAVGSTQQYASSQIAGALVVPGTSHVLIAVRNQLYCIDKGGGPASTAPCPGWPASGMTTGPAPAPSYMAHFMDMAFELGPNPAQVYVSMGTGGNNDGVQCVHIATHAICNGWSALPLGAVDLAPNGDIHYETYALDLHPLPGLSGGPGPVCLFAIDGHPLRSVSNPAALACWDGGGVSAAPALPGFPLCPPNPPTQGNPCLAFTSMGLGSGAGASRVIFARWTGGPVCLDMATGQPCLGFNSSLLGGYAKYRDYGFAPDPLAPNRCVLALGDGGRLYRFDGRTGVEGCPVAYQTTGDPMDFFCKRKPTRLAWSQIVIRQRPSTLVGGTIVVRNAATQTVLMTIAVGLSQNTYSIASIPYAANHSLTIEFTPAYSGSGAVAPYLLEVQFTANEAPQICYQAHVDSCGEIFNRATFGPLGKPAASSGLTSPVVLPSPWTASASVGLGDALPAPCDSCRTHRDPLDLSVRKTAFYPPWTVGAMGEYQLDTRVEQGTLDPATAAGPTFVDNLPAGLAFASFTGAPDWNCVATGQQVACTYHGPPVASGNALPPVTIAVNVVGPVNGGTLRNCAVLGPDANPDSNRSCVDVTIRPCAPGTPDLSVEKEAVGGPWMAGDTGAFRVRVAVRQGVLDPASAPAPTSTDPLPPGTSFAGYTGQPDWSCTAAGQLVSCTWHGAAMPAPGVLPPVTIRATVAAAAGDTTLVNCAQLGPDQDPTNNRSCASGVVHQRADTLDLSIGKEAGHASWTAGGSGVYLIRVRVEHGVLDPATAPTPTFVDVLPPGFTFVGATAGPIWSCTPSGSQVACTYTGTPVWPGTVIPAVTIAVHIPQQDGPFTNCAVLHADADATNNRACVEVVVTPPKS
ncbi:MAG TPA: hypothetical protein VJT67_03895 [Longimicrobiaceae bacterium]|nr:hypothetical protein [Longimicrobiaceae bacterium]